MHNIDNTYKLFEETFGKPENIQYPGHPVTIAWVITHVFDTYDEALETVGDTKRPKALCAGSVPGSSGSVYDALDVLARLHNGESFDYVVSLYDDVWTKKSGPFKCTNDGQMQADKVKEKLLERSWWWK